ncbi:MAG: Sir2 family NAD-dependent protein deacetylase, partial [Halobacteria archaeon]|nr:Sir2 family NAD-dependent protein deacetylase [Halobacteria archaeon]
CDCGTIYKPGSVLFGEQLPKRALYRSQELAEEADVFIAAGSSLVVEPAASLPRKANERGATLVIVNLDSTPLSSVADYDFRDDVTEILPKIRDAVLE